MKFKVPHQVQIGPQLCIIEYKEEVVDDGEKVSGMFQGGLNLIKVSTTENATSKEVFGTIFHETCHGILHVSGQAETIGEDKIEEGLVVCIENHLADTINWKHPMWSKWKMVEFKKKVEC